MGEVACIASLSLICLVLAGSVGLELAAGRDGKAVGSENGHYQVGEAPLAIYMDLEALSPCQLPALSPKAAAIFQTASL